MDQSNTPHDSDLPILIKKRVYQESGKFRGLLQHKVSAPANFTTLTPPTYLTILLLLARIFQQTGTSSGVI